ncbi:DUF2018 domain-containing protein [Campylobacter sp. MIT 99-7217]|uniref:DUF2018 family protein n=1 Tax=Campylobacter sp. MIT 99-7217 TaxID=535091 RepID=UPI00115A5CDB|nr:DUF2018 family protein [Campylobacter sp. MIT 99-7217]TQR31838.1 DUF2018 domain-containing protein [Campylobacter sp. MIT 99-7217]
MDILDEMLSQSPKEKFIQILQNGNAFAVEKAFDDFIAEHLALLEFFEHKGIDEEEFQNFKMHNHALIQGRKDDVFIDLVAKILTQEG